MDNAQLLILLISSALSGDPIDKKLFDGVDVTSVLKSAKRHSVGALAAYALKNAGICGEALKEAESKAMRRMLLFDNALAKLTLFLEQKKIRYMKLKGSVIKKLYPQPWLREMTDIDVLYDSARKEEILKYFSDWEKHSESPHHDSFHKEPIYNVEMHTSLFDDDKELHNYYKDVGKRLVKIKEDGCEYAFTDDDLYVYFMAHAYNHYSQSGIGLRTAADCLLFNRNGLSSENEYIKKELTALNADKFAETLESVSDKLFTGRQNELLKEEKAFADEMITSGTFGTFDMTVHKKMKRISESGGKRSYFLKRLFPDKTLMKKAYPIYRKRSWTLPFCYMHRMTVTAFKRRKTIAKEVKAANKNK